jgi:hypothetical protein
VLKYALALACRDLAIFPCAPRGKVPVTANGCLDATTDSAVIERWWQQYPEANIGIATGARSHIFVVDIDGIDAEAELTKLEARHGALPATVEALTGDGRHVYFAWPDWAVIPNSVGKLGPGLDVRGKGGYVLAPPSVHPSGRRYCWSVDSAKAFAPAPEWLLSAISAAPHGLAVVTPTPEWHRLVRDGVSEGQRNNTIARLSGYLLRYRINALVVLELVLAWNLTRCRPPLDDDEVVRIVDSICGCELKSRGIR